MNAFRITKEKYASKLEASGRANRWNREGQYVIYASTNRALSILELVVHRKSIMTNMSYTLVVISIPDNPNYLKLLPQSGLPNNWQLLENYHLTQIIGGEWYQNKESVILKVPSAIVKGEYNFVINTEHKDFNKIDIEVIEDFEWDGRLL